MGVLFMQQNLSENKLNKIARENYCVLSRYCVVLSEEGYWEEPGKILRKPILEMLDLYLQSCLVKVAIDCNPQLNQAQLYMLANITDTNPLEITKEEGVTEQMLALAKRHLISPPILLQLVGMRDTKKESTMAGLFFDAILNLLLVMSYLSQATAAIYMKCLQEYCETASIFIRNANNQATLVDEKYLFRKICIQDLESSTRCLQEVGEDFEKYKENTMFYREKKVTEQKSFGQKRFDEKELNQDVMSTAEESYAKILVSKEQEAEDSELLEAIEKEKREEKLTRLLQQLDELIGLDEVKQEIRSLVNLIKVKKLREKYRLPEMEMSYHMVFSGNPGTGKTTVARLVAAIYQELGLLSRGALVETDRSGLVAGYVGQTALKVKEMVDKAMGGVLFIDEAYSLASQAGANDFGMEAIDTLVKLMEDNRDDLVVIVAGYTNEMKQFLNTNTGLLSRFNKFIEFKDYSQEELLSILDRMAKQHGFELEAAARELVEVYLRDMETQDKLVFGNARGIRNLFERLVVCQANRIVTYDTPSMEQLLRITSEDVSIIM